MKQLLIISYVFFMLCFDGYGQNFNSKKLPDFFKFWYESPEYIFGNVKEIHIKTFDAYERDGEIVKSGMLISNNIHQLLSSYYFDTAGQIVYSTAQNLAGKWAGIYHYENEKLRTIYWMFKDTLRRKYDYTYPEEGKVRRISSRIVNNQNQNLNSYDLDENGHILKMYRYSLEEEREILTINYTRGDDGAITDKKIINPAGKVTAHYDKWEYNDKNNLLKVHRSILDGEKVDNYGSERSYEYDKKGNWIKQIVKYPLTNNIRIIERSFVFFD